MDPTGVVSVIVAGSEADNRSRISALIRDHPRVSVTETVATARDAVDSARGRAVRPVIVLDHEAVAHWGRQA